MADPARIANLLNLPMLEKAILDLRAEVERLGSALLDCEPQIMEAHARATAAEAERDRLREALERIAGQHIRAEMEPWDAENADWDEGYEAIVLIARAALKGEA